MSKGGRSSRQQTANDKARECPVGTEIQHGGINYHKTEDGNWSFKDTDGHWSASHPPPRAFDPKA